MEGEVIDKNLDQFHLVIELFLVSATMSEASHADDQNHQADVNHSAKVEDQANEAVQALQEGDQAKRGHRDFGFRL